jgi:hypothetical protein
LGDLEQYQSDEKNRERYPELNVSKDGSPPSVS